MIAFIEGRVEEIEFDHIIVSAAGVGYYINTPGSVYGKIKEGDTVTIYTHQSVREDDISLYGFIDKAEKKLFKLLIQVSGIGPKVALNIVGAAELDRLYQAIKFEDMAFLVKLPGIGKKTAQRIVLDLKDKIKDMQPVACQEWKMEVQTDIVTPRGNISMVMQDTMAALEALGYSTREVEKVIGDLIANNNDAERTTWTADIYIKKCLQRLMQD
ncbi:Holliday junction branch migration protein RuvA [Desulfuribacillus alkaliarsenatis]|uniref:Holliday junction branch migration complex subunit RuvA n=1 Tax=Desulfuribacillus alkaliarsenatis TaxID=766136 RepID=A0A1E5G3H8_9FIRM|nr:Holliday junction branch migration protein RuvA [Desulfuribacillus alkaliarsenatis]OEF97614.1 Holliday junction DNA helicase RuvA [Desulfuribacillus alkaliarsenatis]